MNQLVAMFVNEYILWVHSRHSEQAWPGEDSTSFSRESATRSREREVGAQGGPPTDDSASDCSTEWAQEWERKGTLYLALLTLGM